MNLTQKFYASSSTIDTSFKVPKRPAPNKYVHTERMDVTPSKLNDGEEEISRRAVTFGKKKESALKLLNKPCYVPISNTYNRIDKESIQTLFRDNKIFGESYGGKWSTFSQLLTTIYGDDQYYEHIKKYVETQSERFKQFWVWNENASDIPDGVYKVYAYVAIHKMFSYGGLTINELPTRFYKFVDKNNKELNDTNECIFDDKAFITIIIGYLDPVELDIATDIRELKELHRIYEDMFIHIFEQLPGMQVKNTFIPKVYKY